MSEVNVTAKRVSFDEYQDEIRELWLEEYFDWLRETAYEWAKNKADETGKEKYRRIVNQDWDAMMREELEGDCRGFKNGSLVPIIGFVDDKFGGGVYLREYTSDIAVMNRLWVRNKYRGLGLGDKLVDKFMSIVRDNGYDRVTLSTGPYMEAAHSIYLSHGFNWREPYEWSNAPEEIHEDWEFMEASV